MLNDAGVGGGVFLSLPQAAMNNDNANTCQYLMFLIPLKYRFKS
jgi:hypothetical protein